LLKPPSGENKFLARSQPHMARILTDRIYGVTPDLASAPPPRLSQTAWKELLQSAGTRDSVTLHAQISASRGAIQQVAIQETREWPATSAEIKAWIEQKWRFVSGFSGTVTQPVSLKIVRGQAVPTPGQFNHSDWSDTGRRFLARSPKPVFPSWLIGASRGHLGLPVREMGVLLSIAVHHGTIVEVRALDSMGPLKVSEYTAEWVHQHWLFQSNANGTFLLPVYYSF